MWGFIIRIIAQIAASSFGKVLGKWIEYIPGPGQARRLELSRLRKERDEILKDPETARNVKRLNDIMSRMRILEGEAESS